jgi:hypothetical protein
LNDSATRNPLLGLLVNQKIIINPYLPQVPQASTGIEHCWNDDEYDDDDDNNDNDGKEKPRYEEEILSHCHFDPHICHTDWAGI